MVRPTVRPTVRLAGLLEKLLERAHRDPEQVALLREVATTILDALPAAEPSTDAWTAIQTQLGAERPGTAPEAVAADPAVTVFRPRRWRGRDLNRSGWLYGSNKT